MSEKWTPGPWATVRMFPDKVTTARLAALGIGGSIDEQYDRENFAVIISDCEPNTYSGYAHELSRDEARANARLIAAAPDLYAALVEARAELEIGIETEHELEAEHSKTARALMARIDAALAKARGE